MRGSRYRRGRLTEEDLRLWAEVARGVKPLPGRTIPAAAGDAAFPPEAAELTPPKPVRAVRETRIGATTPRPASLSSSPPLAKLERRFLQRLRRGTASPGAVIDLHGLRQEEARGRLVAFLRRCQSDGLKSAIVITGKGAPKAGGEERGVLRRAVPLWLAMPDFRPLVVGFEEAGAGLGGSGALILRIRAPRHT